MPRGHGGHGGHRHGGYGGRHWGGRGYWGGYGYRNYGWGLPYYYNPYFYDYTQPRIVVQTDSDESMFTQYLPYILIVMFVIILFLAFRR